nr:hypothetical protein [Chitinophagaceae bacterium]
FSIDKQRDKVNVEWMSRPVDSLKKYKNNQPLVLTLTSMEQSPTFACRLKRNFYVAQFSGELTLLSFVRSKNND